MLLTDAKHELKSRKSLLVFAGGEARPENSYRPRREREFLLVIGQLLIR